MKPLPLSLENAQRWAVFLRTVRGCFTRLGLLEVTTPTLVQNPGMEPELEPFATQFKLNSKEKKTLYLATSPELHIKQLLAAGFPDLFEVKTVFRNEEMTDNHEPEFQMIEWYRNQANLSKIVQDLREFLAELAAEGFDSLKNFELQHFTVSELFKRQFGSSLTPQTTRDELFNLLLKHNEKPSADATWNDLFHHLWVAKIEPNFPKGLVILSGYPPSMAALSKLTPEGFADRFEFFWDGLEIANAFHELTDAQEQRQRFERDQKMRVQYGRTPLEIDENFMAALESGLPQCAGIALGLDRLFMKCIGEKTIQRTRAFSVRHNL